MRNVNDKYFFNTWQILHRATCPNHGETHWQVGDIEWSKDRHSFFGSAYAISHEVHILHRVPRSGKGWLLMVVVENWWNGKHDNLKMKTWARVLEGNPKTVVAWMRERMKEEEDRNANLAIAPPKI